MISYFTHKAEETFGKTYISELNTLLNMAKN
ncbi:hypothetical protein SCORR_v1c04450 [Spiroplasma corruscae]|uniref:Uncharacterized protein n=1 Tax=Spiroplasma corruscae TaxID=216934 RepID=A0A222ENY3_9MOLU|nr:hypothetical protein SCORR_v1c04450 [Spiroplasma corruscae]